MSVAEIMEQRNAFSFEVFPPKTTSAWKNCAARAVCWKSCTP